MARGGCVMMVMRRTAPVPFWFAYPLTVFAPAERKSAPKTRAPCLPAAVAGVRHDIRNAEPTVLDAMRLPRAEGVEVLRSGCACGLNRHARQGCSREVRDVGGRVVLVDRLRCDVAMTPQP